MKTILVDDELWVLEQFKDECSSFRDIELVGEFNNPVEAVSYAKDNPVDLAFLDIEMPEMSGLELSDRLRETNPNIIIMIVSAHERYVGDAVIHKKVDGFMLKPYSEDDVHEAILRARLLSKRLKKRIYIHTFGRFSVYVDGEPISFRSLKGKEILACIVAQYRGTISSGEIYDNIWGEDRPDSHEAKVVFFNAMNRLKKELEEAGVGDLILTAGKDYSINTEICECDYYSLLEGDKEALSRFDGRLFTEYAWAEHIAAKVTNDFNIKLYW